jgi:putative phosphotransacetylase
MDSRMLKEIISQIFSKMSAYSLCTIHPTPIPIGVSNRHVHLSQQDLETLFGKDYRISCEKPLSQPDQCASSDSVIIAGPKGCIEQVRIIGPVRKQTQVEIMRSDTFKLGIHAPLRESGHLQDSSNVTIIGPKGSVKIEEGLIVAKRHIHMTQKDASYYNVNDGQIVQVKTFGERGVVFDNVVVRVSDKSTLDFHIDLDEANSAEIKTGDKGFLLTNNFSLKPAFNENDVLKQ